MPDATWRHTKPELRALLEAAEAADPKAGIIRKDDPHPNTPLVLDPHRSTQAEVLIDLVANLGVPVAFALICRELGWTRESHQHSNDPPGHTERIHRTRRAIEHVALQAHACDAHPEAVGR